MDNHSTHHTSRAMFCMALAMWAVVHMSFSNEQPTIALTIHPEQGRSTRGGHSGFGRCTFPTVAFFHRAALARLQTAGQWGVG